MDAGSMPPVLRAVAELRACRRRWRSDGASVGLVPTMGALHEGHLALARRARAENDRVIATIFVNPTQFAPHEDFSAYPRAEMSDLEKLAAVGTDLVFAPSAAEMYPDGFGTRIEVGGPSEGLCGAARPHFFGGVATVVAKLLLQSQPDRAYFGEKDYQQLQVIKRLVRDLDIEIDIFGVETVRDPDGLALSSRNAYLTSEERRVAPALYETLCAVAEHAAGGRPTAPLCEAAMTALLEAGFATVDYVAVCDAESLRPLPCVGTGNTARVLGAARLGTTRLIDNVAVSPIG